MSSVVSLSRALNPSEVSCRQIVPETAELQNFPNNLSGRQPSQHDVGSSLRDNGKELGVNAAAAQIDISVRNFPPSYYFFRPN